RQTNTQAAQPKSVARLDRIAARHTNGRRTNLGRRHRNAVRPFAGDPPQAVEPGPWVFFTPEEGAAVEALVDRLIPPDAETAGGKHCGRAVLIDRRFPRAHGGAWGLYMRPLFLLLTPELGLQAPVTLSQ